MSASDPRLRSLLRRAQAVAGANKRVAAVQLYQEIVGEFPQSAEAWLGLASLVEDEDARRQAYERARALDPDTATGPPQEVGPGPDGASSAPADNDGVVSDPFAEARRYLDEATMPVKRPAGPEVAEEPTDVPPGPAGAGLLELDSDAILFCANHPGRETTLRCNRCGKPVCTNCIKRTPVGYRCKECVREQEDAFFTAGPIHYVIALAVAVPLALIGPLLLTLIGGFWFLAIFVSPALGTAIGRAVFYAIGRRRGRYIRYVVAATMILGVLAAWLLTGNLLTLGIYAFLAVSAAYYQLR